MLILAGCSTGGACCMHVRMPPWRATWRPGANAHKGAGCVHVWGMHACLKPLSMRPTDLCKPQVVRRA